LYIILLHRRTLYLSHLYHINMKNKNRALNQSDWNDDERLLAFVANDLGL